MHHKCTHCSKTFKYALSCKTHIQRVHLGIKHECPEDECSKSFQNTKNLKVHLKSQHKVTDPNVLKIIAKKSIRETNKKMKERKITTEDLKSEAKDSKVTKKIIRKTTEKMEEINLVNEDSKSGEVKISNSENIDQVGIDETIIMNGEPMLDDKTELMVMYAGSKLELEKRADANKVYELSVERLQVATKLLDQARPVQQQ